MQAVGAVVGLPAVQALRPQAAAVDDVFRAPAQADDVPVLYTDIAATAVGAQHACRLHPFVRLVQLALVDPHRPRAVSGVRVCARLMSAILFLDSIVAPERMVCVAREAAAVMGMPATSGLGTYQRSTGAAAEAQHWGRGRTPHRGAFPGRKVCLRRL